MKNFINKLFLSWFLLVGSIGIVGFVCMSFITISDSYSAYKAIKGAKEVIEKHTADSWSHLDPNGNTAAELSIIKFSLYLTDPEEEFLQGCAKGRVLIYGNAVPATFKMNSYNSCKEDLKMNKEFIMKENDLISYGCGFSVGKRIGQIAREKGLSLRETQRVVLELITKDPDIVGLINKCKKEVGAYFKEKRNSLIQDLREYVDITENRDGSFSVYLKSGSLETSNISYMKYVSLWLLIPGIIILISFLIKIWLFWLFRGENHN